MQPITTYKNYRSYIQDYYEEFKNRGILTWQIFADKAGFTSASYLKLVCQDKANLSDDGIEKTADSMNLVGFEKDYFKALVHFNQAKKIADKQKALENISAVAEKYNVKILNEDFFSFFSNWYNVVLRELVPLAQPNTNPANIGRQVIPPISGTKVSAAIKYLENQGLLKKNEDGSYVQTDAIISTGNLETSSIILHQYHKQLAQLGLNAIDEIPFDGRDISEVVVGVSNENYKRICEEIAAARKRILAIAAEDQKIERVYCVQTNAFPLSTPLRIKKKEQKNEP